MPSPGCRGRQPPDRFKPGDRFIVQADIHDWGNTCSATPTGALEQYTLIGKEILDGDEGCYLLPVQPTTGYAEAALSEPWACVVASYRATHRPTIKPDGTLWVVAGPGVGAADSLRISRGLDAEAHPRLVVLTACSPSGGSPEAQVKAAGPPSALSCCGLNLSAFAEAPWRWLDDVIRRADAPLVEQVDPLVGRNGILGLVGAGQGNHRYHGRGPHHYDYTSSALGDGGRGYTALALPSHTRLLLALHASGPMGQMHAARRRKPDVLALIVATDVDAERLQVLDRFAARRGARAKIV